MLDSTFELLKLFAGFSMAYFFLNEQYTFWRLNRYLFFWNKKYKDESLVILSRVYFYINKVLVFLKTHEKNAQIVSFLYNFVLIFSIPILLFILVNNLVGINKEYFESVSLNNNYWALLVSVTDFLWEYRNIYLETIIDSLFLPGILFLVIIKNIGSFSYLIDKFVLKINMIIFVSATLFIFIPSTFFSEWDLFSVLLFNVLFAFFLVWLIWWIVAISRILFWEWEDKVYKKIFKKLWNKINYSDFEKELKLILSKSENPIKPLSDEPITFWNDKEWKPYDIFRFGDFSKNIFDILNWIEFDDWKNGGFKNSFSIIIVWEWWGWKSSIINLLDEEYLDWNPNFVVHRFNPWNYEKENLLNRFFWDLSAIIWNKSISKSLGKYLNLIWDVSNSGIIKSMTDFLSSFTEKTLLKKWRQILILNFKITERDW